MRLTNSKDSFGVIAVTLHWVIAAAILYQIWLGDYMTDAEDYQAYQLHKSIGITVLTLSLLRLLIRFIDPPPPLPEGMSRLERIGAHLSHWAFYALMIGIPLSGWIMISASPDSDMIKTRIFGWFELPRIPPFDTLSGRAAIADRMEDVHALLAKSVWFLLALHVLAALKHHFWNKDNVLVRMIPFIPKPRKPS